MRHIPEIFLHGFILNLAAITGLGPQNIFVLQQGTKSRAEAYLTAAVSTAGNAALYLIAGGGGLLLLEQYGGDVWIVVMSRVGIAFLAGYGLWLMATVPGQPQLAGDSDSGSRRRVIWLAIGFSLLNPYAWLDTIVILSASSAQYGPGDRVCFIGGAMLAGAIWFFGLSYASRGLQPLLTRRPGIWRVVHLAAGGLMLLMAFILLTRTRGGITI